MATALFVISAAFAAYVLVGYPVILLLLSRLASRPIQRDSVERSVSIIIAVRNGAAWIGRKLESLQALDYPAELIEILVVLDRCTDDTAAKAAEFERVRVVVSLSQGKPAALNAGMAQARGELLVFTDVRQPLAPDALRRLVACFGDASVGVAGGELVIRDGDTNEELAIGAYWKFEKWLRMKLGALHSVPGISGCLYAMRRSLAAPLPKDALLDDVCQPLNAFFRGYRVIFEPGAKAFDSPTALHAEFRRKVRTLAGVYQVIGFYPRLLAPVHSLWIHFVSYKLGRLLLPYALITAAISSFWLPGLWGVVTPAAQFGGYGLAAIDPWVPEKAAAKRLTAAARTFVVLMAAAVCAGSILFVPAQSLWRETRPRAAAP